MTTESAQQLDELASEYVLGTLSAPEREAVQQRLRNEPELQAAVDAWERRLLDLTDLAGTHPPSPHLVATHRTQCRATRARHLSRRVLRGGICCRCGGV